MKNALTFDLEDYYHVSAFSDRVSPDQWSAFPGRLQASVERILDLTSLRDTRATFFVLGWVAENDPALVRRIAAAGHEIACHSLRHRRVFEMTPEDFREDTRRAKAVLEEVSGTPVRGYRAPSFSITRDSVWAFEILAELGFTYDSSIFPVPHPNYGMPLAPRFPYQVATPSGPLVEFPMPTIEWGAARSPLAGGAYFRLLPYSYTRWGIRFINRAEGQPVCVYLHPWELDPEQPEMKGSLTARIRHHLGLRGTETKLRKLLGDFEFCPMSSLVEQVAAQEQVVTRHAGRVTSELQEERAG